MFLCSPMWIRIFSSDNKSLYSASVAFSVTKEKNNKVSIEKTKLIRIEGDAIAASSPFRSLTPTEPSIALPIRCQVPCCFAYFLLDFRSEEPVEKSYAIVSLNFPNQLRRLLRRLDTEIHAFNSALPDSETTRRRNDQNSMKTMTRTIGLLLLIMTIG